MKRALQNISAETFMSQNSVRDLLVEESLDLFRTDQQMLQEHVMLLPALLIRETLPAVKKANARLTGIAMIL